MAVSALVGAITLALSSSAFVANDIITFKRSLAEELISISKVIASTSVGSLIFEDERAARELLSSFNVRPNIVRATLFDSSLNNFASYSRSAEIEGLRLSGMRADGCFFENDYIVVFQSVVYQGSQIGTLVVEASLDPIPYRVSVVCQEYGSSTSLGTEIPWRFRHEHVRRPRSWRPPSRSEEARGMWTRGPVRSRP